MFSLSEPSDCLKTIQYILPTCRDHVKGKMLLLINCNIQRVSGFDQNAIPCLNKQDIVVTCFSEPSDGCLLLLGCLPLIVKVLITCCRQ